MASQMGSVTRNKRKLDQIAILNARQSLLPQMLMNQQRSEDLARADELKNIQIDQFNKNYELEQDRMNFQRKTYTKQKSAANRAARIGMGLEAGKLGLNIGMQYGDKTVGGLVDSASGTFGSKVTGGALPSSTMNPMLSSLSLGSAVGGGLTGYGISRMVSKKKKGTRIALGAGSGAILGMLSGGPGGAIAGGIGGALGGIF